MPMVPDKYNINRRHPSIPASMHCKLSCCVVLPPRTSPLSILSIVDPLHSKRNISTDSEPRHATGPTGRSAILLPKANQTRPEHQLKQPPVNQFLLPTARWLGPEHPPAGSRQPMRTGPNTPCLGFPAQQTSYRGAWPQGSCHCNRCQNSRMVYFETNGWTDHPGRKSAVQCRNANP